MDNYEPNILPLVMSSSKTFLEECKKKCRGERETINTSHLMKIAISLLECPYYILASYFHEGIRKYKIIPLVFLPTSPPFFYEDLEVMGLGRWQI